ncbi:MAG: dihydrodipicolinate synthase family protein [Planctomycetota bacterium]|nr:MAG: dihydrodipicolinate synthase family protein [Planctomycetota bacterium]
MFTGNVSKEVLARSVIAVPPLARSADESLSVEENRRLVAYLESGGIRNILYGGNAILYHVRISEYAALLEMLAELAGADTWMIPSVGPAYGVMMDQAEALRDFPFPTAMVLPQRDVATSAGVATAIRRFCDRIGRPAIAYLKFQEYLDVADVRRLVADGCVAAIKYAVVRDDPHDDPYLAELLQHVPAEMVVSGIGEQPAVAHMTRFGLVGFTSGCVCVAPRLSMRMLRALREGDVAEAERIRATFRALEDLRNAISPVRVLHRAVSLAGIAETGPIIPLLSELTAEQEGRVREAAAALLEEEHGQEKAPRGEH